MNELTIIGCLNSLVGSVLDYQREGRGLPPELIISYIINYNSYLYRN